MALSDSEILLAIKTAGPMTTGALRQRLGITPQGARQRLATLAEAGLLREEREKGGVGRPRALWSLTATGHARFPDRHAEFSVELIDQVRSTFGPEGLERLIAGREAAQEARYRKALAGSASLEERLERLSRLRTDEGYMAVVERSDDGAFLLTEHHCPICAAAEACQGFCRAELELFRSLLGAEASVERSRHLLAGEGRCAYRIVPTS